VPPHESQVKAGKTDLPKQFGTSGTSGVQGSLATSAELDSLVFARAHPAMGWSGSQLFHWSESPGDLMWDRSNRWQSYVRLTAGAVVLLLLCGTVIAIAGTSAAHRARNGARDFASDLLWPARQMIDVRVPAELQTQVGTLVYRQRQDGMAQVIGRVASQHAEAPGHVRIVIRLSEPAGIRQHGGILKGAPAALSLRDAVRLLVSPDTPADEAAIARDMIWPSIKANVVPGIVDALIREVSADLADPGPEDEELFKRFVSTFHEAIEPLENDLVERLAKRAWGTVGLQLLASGARRQTAGEEKDKARNVPEWWSLLLGKKGTDEAADRPILSPKSSESLKAALEEEIIAFWKDHRTTIVEALKNAVDERRSDFEAAFRERWSGALYDRVVMPAWLGAQAKVMESVEDYVRDFAKRRLLNRQGGPRLLFAYILRSYLDISVATLLMLAPSAGDGSDHVTYESLLQ
jgi:hypothetical protein